MPVTTTLTYDTPSSFTYDDTKIQVQDDVAQLAGVGPYATSNPNILSDTELDLSAISGFVETSVVGGSDAITYTLSIGGVDYYWTGSTWATSDLSYAKTNTAAVVAANLAALSSLVGSGAKVFIRAFLHSNDGSTTPMLESLAVTYTFFPFTPAAPPLTTVYLFLTDILDDVIGAAYNAVLSVTNVSHFKYGNWLVLPFNKSVSFNSIGYASINLMETASVGVLLNFSVSYTDNTKTTRQINFVACLVPNAGAISLTQMTNVQGAAAQASPSLPIVNAIVGGGFPATFQEYYLQDNVSSAQLLLNIAQSSYIGFYLWYSIVRGTNSRMGWLKVISDGTNGNTFPTDQIDAEIGNCGITWSADVETIGGVPNICLSYKTTSTGVPVKMNAVLYSMLTPT